ncbi:MAG: hypothetical protein VKL39_04250, partial [Leptolyngbyaceae bacterium]|nr:hypothetical protein [Leptolyngbyaceae bacterium]
MVANPTLDQKSLRAPSQSLWAAAWRRFRRDRTALFGVIVLTLIILGVVIGPMLYTVPINEIDFSISSQPPSWAHPFGTNDLGQDLL